MVSFIFNFDYAIIIINFVLCLLLDKVDSLGCFKCVSYNGSDEHCNDPYHPISSTYVSYCFAGRQNRRGLFPAHFCYKIRGTHAYEKNKDELFVRDCSVDDLGNMCGQFEYQGKRMNGCILTCNVDGCNTGNERNINFNYFLLFVVLCNIYFK